jgi:hypothetical protein
MPVLGVLTCEMLEVEFAHRLISDNGAKQRGVQPDALLSDRDAAREVRSA